MTSVVFYPLRSHRYMLIFGGDWGSPHPSIVFLVERNGHGNRHSNHCLKDYISSCGGVRNRS